MFVRSGSQFEDKKKRRERVYVCFCVHALVCVCVSVCVKPGLGICALAMEKEIVLRIKRKITYQVTSFHRKKKI